MNCWFGPRNCLKGFLLTINKSEINWCDCQVQLGYQNSKEFPPSIMESSMMDETYKYYNIANENRAVIRPVYALNSSLAPPNYTGYISQLQVLRACEAVVGEGEIHAIVRTGALWRIYPCTQFGRERLLIEGIEYMEYSLQLLDINPFDTETTKLFVGGIPLNISNQEVEKVLIKMGVKLKGEFDYEYIKDENKKSTSCKSGRRTVIIEVPKKHLPTVIEMGKMKCPIFYYGQVRPKGNKNVPKGKEGNTIIVEDKLRHENEAEKNKEIEREINKTNEEKSDERENEKDDELEETDSQESEMRNTENEEEKEGVEEKTEKKKEGGTCEDSEKKEDEVENNEEKKGEEENAEEKIEVESDKNEENKSEKEEKSDENRVKMQDAKSEDHKKNDPPAGSTNLDKVSEPQSENKVNLSTPEKRGDKTANIENKTSPKKKKSPYSEVLKGKPSDSDKSRLNQRGRGQMPKRLETLTDLSKLLHKEMPKERTASSYSPHRKRSRSGESEYESPAKVKTPARSRSRTRKNTQYTEIVHDSKVTVKSPSATGLPSKLFGNTGKR